MKEKEIYEVLKIRTAQAITRYGFIPKKLARELIDLIEEIDERESVTPQTYCTITMRERNQYQASESF